MMELLPFEFKCILYYSDGHCFEDDDTLPSALVLHEVIHCQIHSMQSTVCHFLINHVTVHHQISYYEFPLTIAASVQYYLHLKLEFDYV